MINNVRLQIIQKHVLALRFICSTTTYCVLLNVKLAVRFVSLFSAGDHIEIQFKVLLPCLDNQTELD